MSAIRGIACSRAESHDMGTKPSPAREQRLLHSLVRWCAPRRQSSAATRQSPRLRRHQRPPPSRRRRHWHWLAQPAVAGAVSGVESVARVRALLRWVAALLSVGAPPVKERIHFHSARAHYRHSLCHHQHYSHHC